MKKKVRELIKQRGLNRFPQIREEDTVKEALNAFKENRCGAVLVMQGERLVGLYAERDFAKASLESDGGLKLDSKVRNTMTRKIVYVTPEYHLDECLAVMAKMDVRDLPVMENGRPIALLSVRHIMETLIEDQEYMIDQLVKYITGSNIPEPSDNSQVVVKTHNNYC